MCFYVRKITRSKWTPNENITDVSELSADAITNCLRTTGNSLSIWKIDSIDELKDAVLAIASQQDRLDTIDIVIIDKDKIDEKNLSLTKSSGITIYKDFINRHYDICNLTHSSLGKVALIIVEYCKKNSDNVNVQRFNKTNLKEIIKEGIANHKILITELKEKIKAEVAT